MFLHSQPTNIFSFFQFPGAMKSLRKVVKDGHLFLMNPMQELIAYKGHTDSVLSIRPCMPRERELAVKDKHLWKYRNKLYIEE